MVVLLGAALALLLVCVIALTASPRFLATLLKLGGPALLLSGGLALLLGGNAGYGTLLLGASAILYKALSVRPVRQPALRRRSTIRTAALEVELGRGQHGLDGIVLAGRHEGRQLADLSREALIALRAEVAADADSLALLEAYLDCRFSTWRKYAKTDGNRRQGSAPRAGAMAKEEAYKVLGLEAGASAAEVRNAHRSLLQRLHPDLRRSRFLGARIDEAKDVLVSEHVRVPFTKNKSGKN